MRETDLEWVEPQVHHYLCHPAARGRQSGKVNADAVSGDLSDKVMTFAKKPGGGRGARGPADIWGR